MTTAQPTATARLDRLPVTRLHRYLIAVVGVAAFFDLVGVSSEELKPLLDSAFLGAFVGAVALGGLGDRIGRRRAFLLTLGIYSVFTLLGAFSTNVRKNHTTAALIAPITNSQRQPSTPSGACPASPRARNPAAGTPQKPSV